MKPIDYQHFEGKKWNTKSSCWKKKEKKMKPMIHWGPLYNISKNKFLISKKTLTEYLDKIFIRINNSPAATLMLFIEKLGGNLRKLQPNHEEK